VPGSLPFHRLPLFAHDRFRIGNFEKADNSNRPFPMAEAYHNSILSLPTFTFASDWPLVDQYITAFHKVLDRLDELR
jgi:hypothetical protein